MARKTTAIILLAVGIILTLIGLVMTFFTPQPKTSWYDYAWKAMIGFGILLFIVAAVFIAGIQEVKVKTK